MNPKPARTHTYGERDYAFGQAMVTLRTAMHLTQTGLAQFLGVSRGAVLGWEAGSSYPKAEHLKRFIALGVERQAWAFGREEEEIRAVGLLSPCLHSILFTSLCEGQ